MMLGMGYSSWIHQGFIWENKGYKNFDDYLDTFNSNGRKTIKRERAALKKQGIHTRVFAGQDIPEIFSTGCTNSTS